MQQGCPNQHEIMLLFLVAPHTHTLKTSSLWSFRAAFIIKVRRAVQNKKTSYAKDGILAVTSEFSSEHNRWGFPLFALLLIYLFWNAFVSSAGESRPSAHVLVHVRRPSSLEVAAALHKLPSRCSSCARCACVTATLSGNTRLHATLDGHFIRSSLGARCIGEKKKSVFKMGYF